MAVTLEQIYLEIKDKYEWKQVAGIHGIKSNVDWVHTVESLELIPFLRRRNLVITTGVGNPSVEELLELAKSLKESGNVGLILNIGPYIPEAPTELIRYCDEAKIPLFTLPWEVRLVDFTHDACRQIFQNEQKAQNVVETFLDGILYHEKRRECQNILARYGFGQDTVYQLLVCKAYEGDESKWEAVAEDLRFQIEKYLNQINEHYILFEQNDLLYVVIADYKKEERKLLLEYIEGLELHYDYKFCCGINPQVTGLSGVAMYYEKATLFIKLAVGRNQRITYYDDLEVYKLLMSVEEPQVLQEYYNSILGKLEHYDEVHKTKLCQLLRQYFQENGCVQRIAEQNYVHRNTVNYQMRKIQEILDMDFENWQDRLKVHLCIMAQNLI